MILSSARESRLAAYAPRLVAAREQQASLEVIAETLEQEAEPVTPAGILLVADLVTDGGGPLWGTSREALAHELETTLSVLRAA
jgi:hypothetical protein